MHILLCVKGDLHGCHFLNHLLPLLGGHRLTLWLSTKTRPMEEDVPALAELAYLERGLPLGKLFPLIDALDAGQRQTAELQTFHGLGERFGIQGEPIADIGTPATRTRLRQMAPDLIVSARFSHLFTPEMVALPRHGILNIHPGALPRFAGLFAPMRAVLAGTGELASTLHWIDQGIDSGPILSIHHQPVRPECGLMTQIAELYCAAIPALLAEIRHLEMGQRNPGTNQDRQQREYRSMPSPADLAAFHRTGMQFWSHAEIRVWLQRFMPAGMPLPALLPEQG